MVRYYKDFAHKINSHLGALLLVGVHVQVNSLGQKIEEELSKYVPTQNMLLNLPHQAHNAALAIPKNCQIFNKKPITQSIRV